MFYCLLILKEGSILYIQCSSDNKSLVLFSLNAQSRVVSGCVHISDPHWLSRIYYPGVTILPSYFSLTATKISTFWSVLWLSLWCDQNASIFHEHFNRCSFIFNVKFHICLFHLGIQQEVTIVAAALFNEYNWYPEWNFCFSHEKQQNIFPHKDTSLESEGHET
jgi:hypothetical protein